MQQLRNISVSRAVSTAAATVCKNHDAYRLFRDGQFTWMRILVTVTDRSGDRDRFASV